ncbi:alpha/beta fold hydrolase [Spongisporangium articulatum]|uniref:Alpha/beta fold hydrolase n=1 Tax=Spongisporangium articulatum TaxID=3362603 RepID=A0ABW8AW57_9ACTN
MGWIAAHARTLTAALLALALAACGGGGSGTTPPTSSAPASPEPTVASLEGSFVVNGFGGHGLYLSCRGTGSPTVVYLHDSVAAGAGSAPRKAGTAFASIVEDDQRVCLYDRRGVGDSDRVTGPQTPADALADLQGLLKKADIGGPYVLVGSGFGGLLAYLYANGHRRAVTGLVLLDSPFPGQAGTEALQAASGSDETDSPEHLSRYETLRAAQRYAGREPRIPLVYLTSTAGTGTTSSTPATTADVRAVARRAAFVKRFRPGSLIPVAAARPLETTAPKRVADAVRAVSD